LFGLDLLPQFGDRDVRLRLHQRQHVDLHRFAQAAGNAIARLGTAGRTTILGPLPAKLAHILPTHAEALGKHATAALAPLVRRSDPHPQIVGKCSSHRHASRSIRQANTDYPAPVQMGIPSWIPL
jgi:hypothetical protein